MVGNRNKTRRHRPFNVAARQKEGLHKLNYKRFAGPHQYKGGDTLRLKNLLALKGKRADFRSTLNTGGKMGEMVLQGP